MQSSSSQYGDALKEPYVIVADLHGVPLPAFLIRLENTLAYFTVEGYLELNDTVLACPREPAFLTELPSMDVMRNHSDRMSGKVIRIDEDEVYTVRITISPRGRDAYHEPSDSKSIVVNESGDYCIMISPMGALDLSKFVRFYDIVREQATRRLNILIDLFGVTKFPQTAPAILSDLIDSLAKKKRRIAVVNAPALGASFMDAFNANPCIHFFRTVDDARRYFQRYPIRVLVVEDEPVTAEMIKTFLKQRKLMPITAGSGEEALEIVFSQEPDLVLMDIHLPGIDGIETVRKIREIDGGIEMPIIILTVESKESTVKSGLDLGVNGYILKPFKSDTLSRKILAALTD